MPVFCVLIYIRTMHTELPSDLTAMTFMLRSLLYAIIGGLLANSVLTLPLCTMPQLVLSMCAISELFGELVDIKAIQLEGLSLHPFHCHLMSINQLLQIPS